MVVDFSGNCGGLLILGVVMVVYGYFNEIVLIFCGKFVCCKIMCQDLFDLLVDLDISFFDFDLLFIICEKFVVRMLNLECQDCYKYLNGVGFGFEVFDGVGVFCIIDNGKVVDSSGVILGMVFLGGSDQIFYYGVCEMQQVLVESENIKVCMVRQFYWFVWGYSDGNFDCNILNNLIVLFEQSEYNL